MNQNSLTERTQMLADFRAATAECHENLGHNKPKAAAAGAKAIVLGHALNLGTTPLISDVIANAGLRSISNRTHALIVEALWHRANPKAIRAAKRGIAL